MIFALTCAAIVGSATMAYANDTHGTPTPHPTNEPRARYNTGGESVKPANSDVEYGTNGQAATGADSGVSPGGNSLDSSRTNTR